MCMYTFVCIYMCIYKQCIYMLCVDVPCWEYIFTFASGCTWEQGAAATSPVSGSWIWHDIFSFNTHLCRYICIIYIYIHTNTFCLCRNVSFGEANGSYRINCPWNEQIMVVLSDVCMPDEVEGLRVRIMVISQVHNLSFVPLC